MLTATILLLFLPPSAIGDFAYTEKRWAAGVDEQRVEASAGSLQENAQQLFEEAKAWESRDTRKARSLYERACDLDHGESCSRGAFLYENGSLNRSGGADTIASYRLYIFGCANSHWNSCFMLGNILTHRHSIAYPNVPRDMASGVRYYELACENGVKQACDNLENIAQ